jgi:hypothetical protein
MTSTHPRQGHVEQGSSMLVLLLIYIFMSDVLFPVEGQNDELTRQHRS